MIKLTNAKGSARSPSQVPTDGCQMCCYGKNDVPFKDIVSLIALVIVFLGRTPFFSNLLKLITLHFYLKIKSISTNHARSLSPMSSIAITGLTSCSSSFTCNLISLTFCVNSEINCL